MSNKLINDHKNLLANGLGFIGSFTKGSAITQHIEIGEYFIVSFTRMSHPLNL